MIKVETVLDKNARQGAEMQKENEEVLRTGSSGAVKKSYWPWVLLAVGALVGGWLLLRGKGEKNESLQS